MKSPRELGYAVILLQWGRAFVGWGAKRAIHLVETQTAFLSSYVGQQPRLRSEVAYILGKEVRISMPQCLRTKVIPRLCDKQCISFFRRWYVPHRLCSSV